MYNPSLAPFLLASSSHTCAGYVAAYDWRASASQVNALPAILLH